MILVTGSEGLIGRAIRMRLENAGLATRAFDVVSDAAQDSRDPAALARAMRGVTGVVHLAAISRVVWAEQNPRLCEAINVSALRDIVAIASAMPSPPWIVFASSREVYGDAAAMPVREDLLLAPVNVYARSKVAGERLMADAAAHGLRTSIVRFSNVYGCTSDHSDRVVTAFARTAAFGGCLRLDGAESMFDFTHVDDVARGLHRAVDAVCAGETLPPIHFLTGRGTTLAELARLAIDHCHAPVDTQIAPPRNFDVARFVGDPRRAHELLGWQAQVSIEDGIARLVDSFLAEGKRPIPRPFIDALVPPNAFACAVGDQPIPVSV